MSASRLAITSAASLLPPEILSQIFVEVDPHTLYTSVRALSRGWKQCVEERLLASQFETGRWRVGLRVVRKPKMGAEWRGGRAGRPGMEAPGALWSEMQQRVEEEQAMADAAVVPALSDEAASANTQAAVEKARRSFASGVMARHGALEDELEPLSAEGGSDHSAPIVHVIPLQFTRYDGASTTLQFATPRDKLYALFECDDNRLDLDFGIVWRFPGDGQSDDGWGDADPENGWLSRFYCSSFDVRTDKQQDQLIGLTSQARLLSTPLARRVRRAMAHHDDDDDEEGEEDEEDEDASTRRARIRAAHPQHPGRPMEWSDRYHEYASLSLSLGTEFFVRRSARANFLLRRLEAEVQAGNARRQARRRKNRFAVPRTADEVSPTSSSTPRRSPSRASSSSTPSLLEAPALHRQLLVAAAAASLASTPRSALSSTPAEGSTRANTGASTPVWPAWKRAEGASSSYAAIASTPPSQAGSRRSSFRSTASGPRILRAVPMSQSSGSLSSDGGLDGSLAPLPSVNVSGYASVQHRSPTDEKEAELKQKEQQQQQLPSADGGDITVDAEDDSMMTANMTHSTSSGSMSSKMAISSRHSVPRAHFSAQIVCPATKRGPREWQDGDEWGRAASRSLALEQDNGIAVWEWCR